MYSENRRKGNIAEEIARRKLTEMGFEIIERNYSKKWGEIDIVARGTDRNIYFYEVKSHKYTHKVSRETYNPAENVTREKLSKLEKAIHSWCMEKKYTGKWSLHVIVVRIDMTERLAYCEFVENIHKEYS
jgi:putative endonuclease